ncbi:hypothetical protein B9086_004865 [Morganella morganii subsp. morganii]|uniref:Uncharacterized protein n=1 Tax=Morganella morganii TaxID=582 RepID=A0A2C5TMK5_MORMO|nr:hypothetical protein AL531_09300 [Morganella morganii]RNT15562.1 hypothetical protein B9Z91_007405 [Morganella morganii subsp. morganii]AUR31997.1 hypothetical protein C1O70_11075 [Morganella morganii]AZP25147.1 hypothetical protein D8758_06460 [Morganella morganii]MBE8613873.1 hypothetical protein [Morganella morganii]
MIIIKFWVIRRKNANIILNLTKLFYFWFTSDAFFNHRINFSHPQMKKARYLADSAPESY